MTLEEIRDELAQLGALLAIEIGPESAALELEAMAAELRALQKKTN